MMESVPLQKETRENECPCLFFLLLSLFLYLLSASCIPRDITEYGKKAALPKPRKRPSSRTQHLAILVLDFRFEEL